MATKIQAQAVKPKSHRDLLLNHKATHPMANNRHMLAYARCTLCFGVLRSFHHGSTGALCIEFKPPIDGRMWHVSYELENENWLLQRLSTSRAEDTRLLGVPCEVVGESFYCPLIEEAKAWTSYQIIAASRPESLLQKFYCPGG